jgi:hypothetical protein
MVSVLYPPGVRPIDILYWIDKWGLEKTCSLNTLTFKEISKHKTNSTRKIRKPCKENTYQAFLLTDFLGTVAKFILLYRGTFTVPTGSSHILL